MNVRDPPSWPRDGPWVRIGRARAVPAAVGTLRRTDVTEARPGDADVRTVADGRRGWRVRGRRPAGAAQARADRRGRRWWDGGAYRSAMALADAVMRLRPDARVVAEPNGVENQLVPPAVIR